MSDREQAPFASALRFNAGDNLEIVAQGEGSLARLIEATARKHNIPVFEDFSLCRELAQLPTGEQIPDDLYFAIATLFDFLLDIEHRDAD